jgi:hypothetical protein
MTHKTKRIFHGPDNDPTAFWWDVKWSPAKKGVVINGSLEHAMEGMAGHSIGCRLSNAAIDDKNKTAFPHPVFIAAFYKRIALIVDQLSKNGTPIHAIAYEHDYSAFVDLNDASDLETVYKDKRFYLRPPHNRTVGGKKPNKKEGNNDLTASPLFTNLVGGTRSDQEEYATEENEVFHPSPAQKKGAAFRGAMGRAVKAGILGRSAANQLARAVKKI